VHVSDRLVRQVLGHVVEPFPAGVADGAGDLEPPTQPAERLGLLQAALEGRLLRPGQGELLDGEQRQQVLAREAGQLVELRLPQVHGRVAEQRVHEKKGQPGAQVIAQQGLEALEGDQDGVRGVPAAEQHRLPGLDHLVDELADDLPGLPDVVLRRGSGPTLPTSGGHPGGLHLAGVSSGHVSSRSAVLPHIHMKVYTF